jgi:hypothetical protein
LETAGTVFKNASSTSLCEKIRQYIQNCFNSFTNDTWKHLPPLPSGKYSYPPSVTLQWCPLPDSKVTNYKSLQQKLQIEFDRFLILLESRKKAFTNTHDWENYDNSEEIASSSSDSEQEFQVEEIIQREKRNDVWFYEVKWKYYYDDEATSWISHEHLTGCAELLQLFEENHSL